jgi:hypothetical protein
MNTYFVKIVFDLYCRLESQHKSNRERRSYQYARVWKWDKYLPFVIRCACAVAFRLVVRSDHMFMSV